MFKKFFIPSNDSDITSMAIVVLRVWLGLTMFVNHGLEKLMNFEKHVGEFPDPLGIGNNASLALVVFAEVAGALFLTIGLLTRAAAVVLVINMFVAFFMVQKMALNGTGNGELAFVYLAGFVTLAITGGGLFSTDMLLFSKNDKPRAK